MNMLKTLYGSIHTKDAIAQLDALGISVYKIGEDGSKQFRKAQDVLLDLSVTAQGSKQSMEEVYKSIAGGRMQWSKAGATLGDYKEFIRTWGEAVNSMGFTDKQVGMQLDTLSRRMQTLKTDVQSIAVSGGQAGIAGALKDSISAVDNFVMGLKQIPASSIEAAVGLAVAAKAFVVLKNAIVATNVASLASRATPLGAALTVLGIAAVAATEAMGGLANEQRDAARAAQDQISVAQQQQQQLEKQSEFADALMGAHQKLEAQIANSTEGTAQYNKALENQQETEKQLTGVLGEAAVQRIKDANWSIDAYNKEKQAFEDGVSAKKKALQQMVDARVIELETERDVIKTSIENYWKDAENFKGSLELKAKYLGWWKAIQMEYSEWKIGNAESGISDLKSQLDEIYQQLSEGGNEEILNRRKEILHGQLEQEQASLQSQQDAYQKSIAGGTAELQQQKSDLDQQIISLKQQSLNLAEIPGGLKIATETEDKTKGSKTAPSDTSEQIQKKLDNYNVKSIEDQAAIAQNAYKARLDAITDATNRYGKSYAFLDSTTATMNQHVEQLQNTLGQLTDQMNSDMSKINDLASSTGATISVSGGTEVEQLINDMSAKYGVDPRLAQAIAQVESGKNQEAISSAGAIGVMQLMPDTARGLGVNPYDIAGNIEGGVSYISSLLQEFGGDLEKAIAGYNAGGGAVEKYGGIPPYAETQDYVRKVLAEYNSPTTSSQQVSVSIPQDVLLSAGINQSTWEGMSADSKKEFIRANKEQISDANLLIAALERVSGEQKKIADYEKQIADVRKQSYETLVKGIVSIEEYQQKLADQSKRSSLATLGYYATDSDKAMAEQTATRQKLAASNAALQYAKSRGVNIFTDPTMSEERIKNLELQAQVEQQNTFGTPEARYKQRLAEIEYQHKLSQAQIDGDQTSPMNTQAKLMSDTTAAQEKVKALSDLLEEMKHSGNPFVEQTEEFKKYNLELKEAQKNAKELAETYTNKMRKGAYDVTNELILQGKKISDIWGNLWKQLADDALKALMRIPNESPGLLAQALGIFGGAKGGQQKQKANSWSPYANLLGVAANTWGTGKKYKTPTKAAETFDTSKWNALADIAGTVDKGTKGELSGSKDTEKTKDTKASGGIAWGSILGSLAGLFRANGGIADTPVVAGEDGEEVIIPVQKNTQNSSSLLSYAASKLGQKSFGITPDFSSKDIAKTAMNVSVNSAANMAKTNSILVTQNKILTTMLNNMSSQQGQSTVIINAGGNNGTSMEDQASAYNTLVARRQIKV